MTQNTARDPAREILSGRDEVRAATAKLIRYANRGLAILTPDLEPEIYDHEAFLEPLKKFILARSFARVRVLIVHPERTMKLGNEFVTMGRRLNSYIEIRHVKPELRDCSDAFCIADDRAIVYRADTERWEGMLARDPAVAATYLERFDQLWQDCEVELELRQLHL
jgi:hypothetical protein